MKHTRLFIALHLFLSLSCHAQQNKKALDTKRQTQAVNLPEPYATRSKVNFSKVIGWPEGKTPEAPEGFSVTKFADGFNNPRWIYVAGNGDIFISEASRNARGMKKIAEAVSGKDRSENNAATENRITLLRDTDKDGRYELRSVFFTGLDKPFGMLALNGYFYIAATDGIWRYPYKAGQTKLSGEGEKICTLPAGGYNNHWTRNIIANKNGTKIYVSVGSGSNVAEHGFENEIRRANILEINPDGSGERIFASGLRNPVGMDWEPVSGILWTAVNERDNLGDDLVPDYLTSVREHGFYGWPYSYFGRHPDPRIEAKDQRPELVQKAIIPDVDLGSHTASLGLAFYNKTAFPAEYQGGAFIGQHSS